MTTRATIVGAGGLGGPIAWSLADAGLAVTIVDDDVVEASNLHRQVQFTSADLGLPKATRLAAAIATRGGVARGQVRRWTSATADELGDEAALVIDASDDPTTKFGVADWAVAHRRPYVIASALRFGGNVMVGGPDAGCYRCLFEDPSDAPSCGDVGVLGPIVGVVGGVAAALALGLARGDRRHVGSIFVFDDLRHDDAPRIVRFRRRPGCAACGVTTSIPPTRPVVEAR